MIWFRKILIISIFSENILSFENETGVKIFKSLKSLFNWFDDETTRRCRDWFKMLKTIDEKLSQERMSAIWLDMNISASFN